MEENFFSQIEQVGMAPKLNDEVLICECFCVSVADIREFCAQNTCADLPSLSDHFGLGEGCKECLKKKDYWIDRVL